MNNNKNLNLTTKQITSSNKMTMTKSISYSTLPIFPKEKYSKLMNIKAIKVTDMYKNLYHRDTGKAISSIINQNDKLKITENRELNYKYIVSLK